MLPQLLSLAMLLPSDAAVLKGARLLPNATNAIASVVGVRAATTATAQYTSYPVNTNSAVVIGATFAAGSLSAGNQVRIHVYGTLRNAGVGTEGFVPIVRVTQTTAVQTVGATWSTPNTANPVAWVIDAAVSFSHPGPALTPDPARVKSQVQAYVNPKPLQGSLVVGGMLQLTQTDTTAFGGVVAGGNPLSGMGASSQSLLLASLDPNSTLINNAMPTGVTLELSSDTDVTFIVMGGWMEVM
jgi:hypothetical protein